MSSIIKFILQLLLIAFLTVLTQVGGLVYLLSAIIVRLWKRNFRFKTISVFLVLYLITTLLVVPLVAPLFGRERVKHTSHIKPTNYMTVLLNRNYVRPPLNRLLQETQNQLTPLGIEIRYLDANFPFIDKFPLLPHLSHNDGKKIDISLIYQTPDGKLSNKQKSISGYGVFEGPKPKEYDQIDHCFKNGYYQYDFPKYFTLGAINDDLVFSERGTQKLISSLLKQQNLGKIFLEPHLRQRLGLQHPKLRYQGCRSVRHDDHIHVQLK
ncbi:MAG: hypothetical protein ACWA5P_13655 [bacterium]